MSKLVNIAKYKADTAVRSQREGMIATAKEVNWKYWLDDIPVSVNLMNFATAVKDVMPNLTFLPIDTGHVEHGNETQSARTIRVYNELCLCMEGNPFDLGRINFKDNSVGKGTKESTFGVYSRKIQNAKYGTHRSQFNMIMSSDVAKAVKNVSKYVVPYSAKELAQAFYDPMARNVTNILQGIESKARDHVGQLRHDWGSMLTEIRSLKAKGVEFITPEFKRVAETVDDVYGAYEAEKARKVSALFVRFHKIGEETYVTLQEACDIRGNYHDIQLGVNTNTAIPVSELPEEIVGSVSVLNILNNEQYVANVGMKLDSNHYWIERG